MLTSLKRTQSRSVLFATAVALCALHAWMAASVSRTFSTTSDEIAHLTSGYIYWTQQDYRFQPENGNLPQRVAALPLLWMDITPPSPTGPAWQTGDMWSVGHEFFYNQGNDPAAMLAASRAAIAFFSATLCFVIFLWTLELLGWRCAMMALLMAAFAPELLAHGGLATSDTAASLGFTLAVMAWWRVLHRVSLGRVLIAGLCAGLLAISKHSVVLFAPISILLILVRLLRPAPLLLHFRSRRLKAHGWWRAPVTLAALTVSAAICGGVIWSAYGFRYQAAASGLESTTFVRPWASVLLEDAPPQPFVMADHQPLEAINPRPSVIQAGVRWMRDYRLLPEAWLYGLAFVEVNSRARLAFFAGDYRTSGWPEFFPVAFALKTTLPTLTLGILSMGVLFAARPRKRRLYVYRLAPLFVLLTVYWVFSVQSSLNIGHRHLLPIYPACYILASAAFLTNWRRPLWLAAVATLVAGHIATSLSARPDYLAYFNPLAGGSSSAHRLFVDSSLDWGQDLPRLHEWLEHHAQGHPVFLSYFGTGSPSHTGIRSTRVGDNYFNRDPHPTPPPLKGGVYCLSATMFRRVYTHVRGPWSQSYEDAYQRLDKWIAHVSALPERTPFTEVDGTSLTQDEVQNRLFNYEQLIFGRLCHFLENRPPDAQIGGSILIWRLSNTDVGFALSAPLPVLNRRLLELRMETMH